MIQKENRITNTKDVPASVQDINVVEIPEETAPKKKRYDSPGYLLKHPEQVKQAMRWTVTHNALAVILLLVVLGYLFAELQSFIYLLTHYGFLR